MLNYKYLKYKNKYIKIKNEINNDKLEGGGGDNTILYDILINSCWKPTYNGNNGIESKAVELITKEIYKILDVNNKIIFKPEESLSSFLDSLKMRTMKLFYLFMTILPDDDTKADCSMPNVDDKIITMCNNFVIYNDDNTIIISFKDYDQEKKNVLRLYEEFKKHNSFLNAYMIKLCNILKAKQYILLRVLYECMNKGKKIYLTGYSLGGICALYLHIILQFLFKYKNLETYIFEGFPIIPHNLQSQLYNVFYIINDNNYSDSNYYINTMTDHLGVGFINPNSDLIITSTKSLPLNILNLKLKSLKFESKDKYHVSYTYDFYENDLNKIHDDYFNIEKIISGHNLKYYFLTNDNNKKIIFKIKIHFILTRLIKYYNHFIKDNPVIVMENLNNQLNGINNLLKEPNNVYTIKMYNLIITIIKDLLVNKIEEAKNMVNNSIYYDSLLYDMKVFLGDSAITATAITGLIATAATNGLASVAAIPATCMVTTAVLTDRKNAKDELDKNKQIHDRLIEIETQFNSDRNP